MVQTLLPTPTTPDLDRSLLVEVTWEQFKLIKSGFAESKKVRLFYDNNTIEILMPGRAHETISRFIGFLICQFCLDLNIVFETMGSTTQEREGEAYAEPDESFCFGTQKAIPDLVIEVIFTSGSLRKLQRYRSLGIPEVWFWQDSAFSLYHLHEGDYRQITKSEIPELAGLDIELLTRCVLMAQTCQLDAANTFRHTKK